MLGFEANYDGLIGPTHNYGGLSEGNLASARNKGLIAAPRAAALEGLAKMKLMADHGLVQGVLPPHQRPFLPALRELGYSGSDEEILSRAWAENPVLVRNFMSASPMWAANAATISPSADTDDGRLHFTPANLSTMLHRSIEHEQTGRALRVAFPGSRFAHHKALPIQATFSDEGAANHVRLCANHGAQGVELFVYGRDALAGESGTQFPARQSLQACQTIVRHHRLDPARTVFARQSARAIDAGAFHNDVVCVGALNCLFYHEHAFGDTDALQAAIRQAAKGLFEPVFVEVSEDDVPLGEAITSYLFNSMLVQMPGASRLTLIAPVETEENAYTKAYCEKLVSGNGPIGAVHYVDVRQSMRNGGGPACLRLRIAMNEAELAAANPDMVMNDALYTRLTEWVRRHYREELAPDTLGSADLMRESFTALDELTGILGLGSDFYPFQRV
ncbi:MAG TPA: N-succinylarginine dihydrolase [Hellea balneolensis]|uniref:N-succinylarginine dihydrolase n=1 Tax=Hellea balneolensis TaxID=287478 RepID=A0A7V5U127_9PROT|nr:N-succinylarginine dihydrolase [Hellea balneolensis]